MEQVEPVNDTLLLTEWQALIRQTSPDVHTLLTSLSDEEIRHLVTVFYDYMLSHAQSALFLNTEQVSTRLSGSMFDWLRSVLGSAHEDLSQLLAKQRKIGVVHARIGLPIDLVNRGARKLKDELYRVLKTKADDSSSLLSDAICFSSLAMDTALEAMTVSYSQAIKTPCIRRSSIVYKLFTMMLTSSVSGKSVRLPTGKISLSITLPPECLSERWCFWRTLILVCGYRIRENIFLATAICSTKWKH